MTSERDADGFEEQFALEPRDYMEHLDFLNWIRYWYLFATLRELKPDSVLEFGPGEGTLRRAAAPLMGRYESFDINPELRPDHVGDIRHPQPDLEGRFDCTIAADILEHIPFEDLPLALANMRSCLRPGGHALITIPHRRTTWAFMTPTKQVLRFVSIPNGIVSPGGFYRRFIKRKIWIDPHHRWEIGDGTIKRKHVENEFEKAGFRVEALKPLVYVDYWSLRKP